MCRRTWVLAALLLFVPFTLGGTQVVGTGPITSPREHFGAAIGDDYFLATWQQFETYWHQLDRESNRMSLVDIGPTEEGRRQWMAIVTAPENFARLERYRDIARRLARAELAEPEARALAREGRAIVWIDGGQHADEVLGAQQLIETVYQLVSGTDAETTRILRDVIVLAVHANPDGHALVADWYMRERVPSNRSLDGLPRLYQKYAGHDNNRDFYMGALAETNNMNRVLYRQWFPQIVYNHHQTAPPGTVMFAPPFAPPFNYVFDPLIQRGLEQVGAALHARFSAEGKPGVTMRSGGSYSAWWNGGLRTTPYFHNQLGLLTETIGSPNPTRIAYVADTQMPSADLPLPIAPQRWRFRQSIDYSLTANRAVLDFASGQRESLLMNIYRMGRNAIERGLRDSWTPRPHLPPSRASHPAERDPRGYIVPADQPDFPTATKFINALIRTGVDVHRAVQPFTVAGRTYPEGSYVVRTAQAFRPHVLDMFEPQDHPDDSPHPGAPPRPPYDMAGWTLAMQMGVRFVRVLDAFEGPFERVPDEVHPPSRVVAWTPAPGTAARPDGYLLNHHQNDAFVAVNRLLKAGEEVYWLKDRGYGGEPAGTGSMYVPERGGTRGRLEAMAAQLGISVSGVASAPVGPALRLRRPRIGLVDKYGGSVPAGWLRWLLEQYEFPFEVVYPAALDEGALASRFDVLVFADDLIPAREPPSPARVPNLPPQYADRVGAITVSRTVPQLRSFVEAGGTVIALGESTVVGAHLGLTSTSSAGPSTVPASGSEAFYVPGSILQISVDNQHPLAYGFERHADVFFDRSPVFRLTPGSSPARIAWFSSPTPLRSGWALGQQALLGASAVVDAPLGRGRVLLLGPQVAFRGQSHGTFRLVFNGVLYPSATTAALR